MLKSAAAKDANRTQGRFPGLGEGVDAHFKLRFETDLYIMLPPRPALIAAKQVRWASVPLPTGIAFAAARGVVRYAASSGASCASPLLKSSINPSR